MLANIAPVECVKMPVAYIKSISSDNIVILYMQRYVLVNGVEVKFTKIDFDMLYCFMNHRGWVLSFEQIYDHVWGDKKSTCVRNSVKCAVKRLRKKIAIQSNRNNRIIETVRGGWV